VRAARGNRVRELKTKLQKFETNMIRWLILNMFAQAVLNTIADLFFKFISN